ncbi:MAG: DUF5702 domain-containing protein [Lachnospiraceae bacterium]|nr:DUF5702 domain-containing protein [Lachnospiraceae bacterium]
MRRASITVFFSLLFPILLALILYSIASAKVEAGSCDTAYAVDQSFFTLFGRYDQPLFQKYDVFYLDGSCGSGSLAVHEAGNYVGKCMDELLANNNSVLMGTSLLHLKRTATSVTGYMLMTDAQGASFETQAIASMKDTPGTSALSALSSSSIIGTAVSLPTAFYNKANGLTSSDLPTPTPSPAPEEGTESTSTSSSQHVYNPIPLFEALKSGSVMPYVVDESRVSTKVVPTTSLPSQRSLNHGFGTMQVSGTASSTSRRVLYSQYLLTHFTNFRKPGDAAPLSYEVEYMLGGSGTDRTNLEYVVKKLMKLRQPVNFAFLMSDSAARSKLQEAATLIASAISIPEAWYAVELILMAGWSYVESIIDVRDLLDGKTCPLVKTEATWQVSFEEVADALAHPGQYEKDAATGMGYLDYLKTFLYKESEGVTMRALDMVELEMQAQGRSWFRVDCLLDSLDLHVETLAEEAIPIAYEAHYDYRSLSASSS